MQGRHILPCRLHAQPLPQGKLFVLCQRLVDFLDLTLKVAELRQEPPFQQFHFIEVALLFGFVGQQRRQFAEPFVLAPQGGFISSRFGIELVHLRLESQLRQGHPARLATEGHFIAAHQALELQTGSTHGPRNGPDQLVGGCVIRTDDEKPLVGSNLFDGERGQLGPSG